MSNPFVTAARITFDDLPSAAQGAKVIPSTYRGLKWTGISYSHELQDKKDRPASVYATAFILGGSPHITYFKKPASIKDERPNETFTFVSLTACAAWNDDLQFSITGYRNPVQNNARTATLLFGRPQLILLRWKNIDKIVFTPFGGTQHPGSKGGTGSHVVITQLIVDPLN